GALRSRGDDVGLRGVALPPGGGAAQTGARPARRAVDVVGQRDRERRVGKAERAAQALERRIERVEGGPLGAETAVPVPWSIALLDAGQVEEAVGNVVAGWTFAPVDLLPGCRVVGNVVPEAELGRAD